MWFLSFSPLHAQLVTASIQGTIRDSSSSAVPGATVRVVNTSTGIVTTTDTNAEGRFVFASLALGGPYTLTVEAKGFRTEDRTGINLEGNQLAQMDIVLKVGSASEKVEVSADATQLETSNAARG